MFTLYGHSNQITCLLELPFNILASGSSDNSIKIWNTLNGSLIQNLYGHKSRISTLIYSSFRNVLISGSFDFDIIAWLYLSSKKVFIFSGHSSFVNVLISWSNNSFVVSGSGNGEIFQWDLVSGTLINRFVYHIQSITSLVTISNHSFASGSEDLNIIIWDVISGKLIFVLTGHMGSVNSLLYMDNDYLISCSSDKQIIIWNTINGTLKIAFEAHQSSINVIVKLSNQSFISGSDDTTVKLWEFSQNDAIQSSNMTSIYTTFVDLSSTIPPTTQFIPTTTQLNDFIFPQNNCPALTVSLFYSFNQHFSAITSLLNLQNGFLAIGSVDQTISLSNPSDSSMYSLVGKLIILILILNWLYYQTFNINYSLKNITKTKIHTK